MCVRSLPGAALAILAISAAGCGDDFTICTDPGGDAPGCEVCSNSRDDDLDGFVDCGDRECAEAAFCATAPEDD